MKGYSIFLFLSCLPSSPSILSLFFFMFFFSSLPFHYTAVLLPLYLLHLSPTISYPPPFFSPSPPVSCSLLYLPLPLSYSPLVPRPISVCSLHCLTPPPFSPFAPCPPSICSLLSTAPLLHSVILSLSEVSKLFLFLSFVPSFHSPCKNLFIPRLLLLLSLFSSIHFPPFYSLFSFFHRLSAILTPFLRTLFSFSFILLLQSQLYHHKTRDPKS